MSCPYQPLVASTERRFTSFLTLPTCPSWPRQRQRSPPAALPGHDQQPLHQLRSTTTCKCEFRRNYQLDRKKVSEEATDCGPRCNDRLVERHERGSVGSAVTAN